jgi:hypothetical protein
MTAPPPPVSFTFDEAESRRIRKQLDRVTGKTSVYPLLAVGVVLELCQPLLRFHRYGWHDSIAWVLAVVMLAVLAASIVIPLRMRNAILPAARPGVPTSITFDETTVRIARSEGTSTRESVIAITDIGTVSMLPDAITIAKNLRPLLVVPKRAFPDGGAELMRFFEGRLVGKRMLRRSTSLSTSIVNTRSR